jgi:YD repeat-containing protein
MVLAVRAAEPFLGPRGWTQLGPFPAGLESARGTVVFDLRDCAVEVSQLDLDGGPGFREIRLARTYVAGVWQWLDDWEVADGVLLRPGRAPVPVASFRGTLETDADGWVTRRRLDGREVEILRNQGAFAGMRSGAIDVRLDAGRGVASDGRAVRYLVEDDRLVAVTASSGVTTRYGYADGGLSSVSWADGGVLRVTEDGTRGAGGAWSCRRDADRAVVRGPDGGAWTVQDLRDGQAVFDPSGAQVRVTRRGETLSSWRDPRGNPWMITHDGRDRPIAIDLPSGGRWSVVWTERGLGRVVSPTGGRWDVSRDADGRASVVTAPSGAATIYTYDPQGSLREARGDLGVTVLGRDAAGRVTSMAFPGRGDIRLARDSAGRVAAVTDGGGGTWTFSRDGAGNVTRLVEPAGGRWDLAYDRMGLPREVRDPAGGTLSWTRRVDGALASWSFAALGRWEVLRGASGRASGLRDPLGRQAGWLRDAAGRVSMFQRADMVRVSVRRDAAGDVVAAGDVSILRDARGLAVGLDAPGGQSIRWARDAAGELAAAQAGGLDLALGRAADGRISEVRWGNERVRLVRGAGGKVARVEGTDAVDLVRDPAGRVVSIGRGLGAIGVQRGARGWVDRLRAGDREWFLHRDASGRLIGVEGPGGAVAGVDRDAAGRPALARFADGGLVRFTCDGLEVEADAVDADGRDEMHVGWARDASGEVISRTAGRTWALRRDPAGQLVVAESGEDFWSASPDGVEGPGGWRVSWGEDGRVRSARIGAAEGSGWGLPAEELRYRLGAGGRVESIDASTEGVELTYDAIGRLAAWRGPGGLAKVERDALGIARRVAGVAVEGALGLLLGVDGSPRAHVPGVLLAGARGGLLLDPLGGAIAVQRMHASPASPAGLPLGPGTREIAAGGRLHLAPGGPLLGLLDAIDPLSGQDLGPGLRLPWVAPTWEIREASQPWPSPDGATAAWWDPASWSPESSWWDPLAVLVQAGELPAVAHVRTASPGLPWLPASVAPVEPALGPATWPTGEDAVTDFVLSAVVHARAPAAEDLAAWLLAAEVAEEFPALPGLRAPLPPGLDAAIERLAAIDPAAI